MPRRPGTAKAQRSPDLATTAAAAIQRAADGAAEELAVLQAEVAVRDSELERLQAILDDRQRVIDELGAHAAAYRRAADERAGLLAELDFQLQRLRADLARAERQREAEVRSALRDAETLRARAGVLETALAARARLVEELQTICDERGAAIDRLSEEAEALRRVADERERAEREISAEAERRSALLAENEAKYRALEAQLASITQRTGPADETDWRSAAEERERALQEVSAEAERRSVLLAELTAALEGRTREVEDLRRRLTRAS